MRINRREILKKASLVVASLIVILLLILGVKSSDFGKIAKYDQQDKSSPRERMSKSSFLSRNGMQVVIVSDNMANLGDFTFNISGDRKLIANIALKYKANDTGWFSSKNDIKKEIIKKSVVLRDAAIDTMLGNSVETANSDTIRTALKNTLNKKLSEGEIEEVYFNQFIIQ